MRKPVTKWTSEDVAEWVEGLGEWAEHNYSQIFRKEVNEWVGGRGLCACRWMRDGGREGGRGL